VDGKVQYLSANISVFRSQLSYLFWDIWFHTLSMFTHFQNEDNDICSLWQDVMGAQWYIIISEVLQAN
jgi:hypothetical protein